MHFSEPIFPNLLSLFRLLLFLALPLTIDFKILRNEPLLKYIFNIQVVKVQSLKLKAPSRSGPKTLRVFKNQPRTLDFSQAEGFESVQVYSWFHVDID